MSGAIGMLWLDDDEQRPLTEKVARAVAYFEQKHGRLPVYIETHEGALSEKLMVGEVEVRPCAGQLPCHFFLVMEA